MKDRGRGHGSGVIGKMKNRSTKLQERVDFRATLAKFFNNSQEPRVKTRGMLAQLEDAVQATATPMASVDKGAFRSPL
jgi:hypothetical protein